MYMLDISLDLEALSRAHPGVDMEETCARAGQGQRQRQGGVEVSALFEAMSSEADSWIDEEGAHNSPF